MSQSQASQLSQSDIEEITAHRYIHESLTPGALSTRLQVMYKTNCD